MKYLLIFLALAFSNSLIQAVCAQGWTVTIHVSDNSGGQEGEQDLVIGTNPDATYCLDDSAVTPAETEAPPPGPDGVFDARLIGRSPGDCRSGGSYVDIREHVRDTQSDTFYVRFKSSTEGVGGVTFSWDPNIGDIGPGGWILHVLADPPDIPTDIYFDMTTASSYQHPLYSDINQKVEIMTYDAYMMRTFTIEELAFALNEKGRLAKGKGVKRKPTRVDFCLYVVVDQPDVTDLHMEFSHAIDTTYPFYTIPPSTASPLETRFKKWNFIFSDTLHTGDTVYVYGYGNKGKPQKIPKYWWTLNNIQVGDKKKDVVFDRNDLKLPFPNPWNGIDEVYMQGAVLLDTGIALGIAPKKVIHKKKAKEIYKTLIDRTGLHSKNSIRCLDFFANGKPITRIQKALPPKKHNNGLLAEALVLKVNIILSDEQKTPAGFGDMVYSNSGHAYDGQSVREIAAKADTALACQAIPDKGDTTLTTLMAVIQEINHEFSGPIDTISFGNPAPGKLQGTQFTGVRPVGETAHLYRLSLVIPPAPERKPFVDVASIPQAFSLRQNYPNPFNPTTTIEFTLPEDALVTLKVYNVLGQEVVTLADREEFYEGENEVEFEAIDLPTGVYFYRIAVYNMDDELRYLQVRKMILIK
ncbi:MAG: T9SS type A sorting domain-containing protein [Ignavibacteriae bacterium]|nr:T9SS type A sorting domain-containing protein [Ignavibacteriota bacterium]